MFNIKRAKRKKNKIKLYSIVHIFNIAHTNTIHSTQTHNTSSHNLLNTTDTKTHTTDQNSLPNITLLYDDKLKFNKIIMIMHY